MPDGSSAFIGVDGTRSRGIAFDVSGQVRPGWFVNGAFTHVSVKRHANDLIYANLFHRAPDVAGRKYWVAKLEQGTSRGHVMVQFSESNEYRTKSLGVVEAADLLDDMLGSAGGPSTVALWGRHLQGGGNQGDMGMALTLLNAY